jgi:hypothetical protein
VALPNNSSSPKKNSFYPRPREGDKFFLMGDDGISRLHALSEDLLRRSEAAREQSKATSEIYATVLEQSRRV